MVEAMAKIESILSQSHKLSTLQQLSEEVQMALTPFAHLGGGVERLHSRLFDQIDGDLVSIVKEATSRLHAVKMACRNGPDRVVNDLLSFVRGNSRIIVHGCSALLAQAITSAITVRPGVTFYFTEGLPKQTGQAMLSSCRRNALGYNLGAKLDEACTVVPDSAVGLLMDDVSTVWVGAYAVTEHGGLIHGTGTSQIATLAAAAEVPMYVLCETFKFCRLFPLSTKDLCQPSPPAAQPSPAQKDSTASPQPRPKPLPYPLVEFVPPSRITLVFTEEGIMPPSGVADEMFRNKR